MAGEFKHKTQGTQLDQDEYEDLAAHVFDGQATGDILFASSATQLSRLAKANDGDVLTLAAGIPAWTSTPTLGIVSLASGSTIGNLTLADGSITDSGGAISFGNEALSTTGTFASGALTVTGAIRPNANNGGALGASGTAWSDLFLADGGMINFNAGEVTLTQTNATLNLSGADFFVADTFGLVIGHPAHITDVAAITMKFQVLGTDAATASVLMGRWSNSSSAPTLYSVKGRGTTIGVANIVADNDQLFSHRVFAEDGSSAPVEVAKYIYEVDDISPANGDIGGAIVWLTAGGSGTALRETMRLAATGALELAVAGFTVKGSLDSAAVADQVSFGRYDIGASNTVIALSQETAVAVEVDETKFSHKMQVRLNGATYFMMLTDS